MKDAGYTLAETLAALAIVALAIAGLSAGVQVLSRQQARVGHMVADTQARRAAQAALDRVFEGSGPFRSNEPERLAGAADSLGFDCGRPDPCLVRLVDEPSGVAVSIAQGGAPAVLPLRTPGPLRFLYQGAEGPSDSWPPAGEARQRLRSIAVVREADQDRRAIIKARLWVEQPARCAFDVILQDCR